LSFIINAWPRLDTFQLNESDMTSTGKLFDERGFPDSAAPATCDQRCHWLPPKRLQLIYLLFSTDEHTDTPFFVISANQTNNTILLARLSITIWAKNLHFAYSSPKWA
jgi:hypothetical protein